MSRCKEVKKESNRETGTTLVTGRQGVGKTFTTAELIDLYHEKHSSRRVLIFDPNNEKVFHKYKTLYFDITEIINNDKRLKKNQPELPTKTMQALYGFTGVRRVVAYKPNGTMMSNPEKKRAFKFFLSNFTGGLFHAEDVATYESNFMSEEVSGMLRNMRHKSNDMFMHVQSLNGITTNLVENIKCIRIHEDTYPVNRLKMKLSDHFEIIKLGRLIVANEYFEKGNKRFFLFVFLQEKKLSNVTAEQFAFALQEFVITEKNCYKDELSRHMHNQRKIGRPTFDDIEAAQNMWMERRLSYIDEKLHNQVRALITPKKAKQI